MDFITGVNRLMRINHIIRGDDDDITTFAETQHAAHISLAQIAIQDELADLISDRLIPYEKTNTTLSLVTSTRTYALASDFIRFYGTAPSLYDSTDNVRIYEYPGGEDRLKDNDYQYKTSEGAPTYWYWDNTTTKQVAFYNVPQSSYNGRSISYDYEKSVSVTNSTDVLPFHNDEEAFSFISMAARRFAFMVAEKELGILSQDMTYSSATSRLYSLLRFSDPSHQYGRAYL